jgi:hypothetical protein
MFFVASKIIVYSLQNQYLYSSYNIHEQEYAYFVSIFSVFLTIIILIKLFRLGVDQCPSCSALKGKEEIGSDLLDTTYLGNKWKNDGTEKNVNMNQYAVFEKTYRDYNCCKYCGYEWTTISEGRSEERL